jgi:hypothetical protein
MDFPFSLMASRGQAMTRLISIFLFEWHPDYTNLNYSYYYADTLLGVDITERGSMLS